MGNPASSAMLVSGSYSFFTPEGELVEMQYTADENGMTIIFVNPWPQTLSFQTPIKS